MVFSGCSRLFFYEVKDTTSEDGLQLAVHGCGGGDSSYAHFLQRAEYEPLPLTRGVKILTFWVLDRLLHAIIHRVYSLANF